MRFEVLSPVTVEITTFWATAYIFIYIPNALYGTISQKTVILKVNGMEGRNLKFRTE
jgi:hypothetical protein